MSSGSLDCGACGGYDYYHEIDALKCNCGLCITNIKPYAPNGTNESNLFPCGIEYVRGAGEIGILNCILSMCGLLLSIVLLFCLCRRQRGISFLRMIRKCLSFFYDIIFRCRWKLLWRCFTDTDRNDTEDNFTTLYSLHRGDSILRPGRYTTSPSNNLFFVPGRGIHSTQLDNSLLDADFQNSFRITKSSSLQQSGGWPRGDSSSKSVNQENAPFSTGVLIFLLLVFLVNSLQLAISVTFIKIADNDDHVTVILILRGVKRVLYDLLYQWLMLVIALNIKNGLDVGDIKKKWNLLRFQATFMVLLFCGECTCMILSVKLASHPTATSYILSFCFCCALVEEILWAYYVSTLLDNMEIYISNSAILKKYLGRIRKIIRTILIILPCVLVFGWTFEVLSIFSKNNMPTNFAELSNLFCNFFLLLVTLLVAHLLVNNAHDQRAAESEVKRLTDIVQKHSLSARLRTNL